MKITHSTKSSGLKIYIDGLLHINIGNMEDLTAIQSWVSGENNYWIEFYMREGENVQCQYNDFKKWQAILKILDSI